MRRAPPSLCAIPTATGVPFTANIPFMKRTLALVSLLIVSLLGLACRPATVESSLPGLWRGVLTSPGGELPFGLEISSTTTPGAAQAPETAGTWSATVWNGPERVPLSGVDVRGREVVLRFEGYDSRIVAQLDGRGETLKGHWEKTGASGVGTMPFEAKKSTSSAALRFRPLAEVGLAESAHAALVPSIAGNWAIDLTDDEGTTPAVGELSQNGATVVGTLRTPTGDHRFLEGSYEGGVLRLSAFDGGHAFLYRARATESGTLDGDFWSRDAYHATWTARKARDGEVILPDAWNAIGLNNSEGAFRFTFPDLEGKSVGLSDPRFTGKVVLVNLFGSWCPNCNDEAPLLAAWHREYRDRGLEVIGLAYEVTGNVERDRELVRRFAKRHGTEYPLLLAGTSDKKAAGATLPDLSAVAAFPTTIFIGRDGKVRKIHSGFDGPGTGKHFEALQKEFVATIEELLGS